MSMITSELAVVILPCRLICNCFHHVPVLGDLSVLDSPQVVIRSGDSAKCAFAYTKNEIALSKYHVNSVIDHADTLLCHSLKCGSEP